MPPKQSILSAIGKIAQDVLSIAGFFGLLWTIFQYWDKPFETMIKPGDTIVRPICEVISSKYLKYSDGTAAAYKLLGFEIKNEKDVNDLRLKIINISYIDKWTISSDKITDTDAVNLIAKLPTGLVKDKDIYIDFPRIMAKGDTFIQFYGITPPDFKPDSEWFFASSATTTVNHLMYPSYHVIREMYFPLSGPDFYKIAFWGVVIPACIYLVFRRALRRQKHTNTKKSEVSANAKD
jgi:hypothetical protein